MESFYLFIVIILFILAFSDLIVGVSNDAVNFLNSAIGSKAAPFTIILIIATAGILMGATFSNGMMEIARKGIFHPDQFYFSEIMIIFLAVMITDIILLDLFNTFGLPTSTTVSIVFELLGAAVAIALIKVTQTEGITQGVSSFINSAKALEIVSGILSSVVIAFAAGSIIQYIVRLLFSFDYSKTMKYFGGIWGGIAVASITYFLLIKGAKGSSFISAETLKWIQEHSLRILLISFAGWSVLFHILLTVFKVNILKVIVLVGTFSLAFAFAGNDLVNFIGVPLAGFESFKVFAASGGVAADFTMDSLREAIKTPTFFLLIAGVVMAFALWFSKKARTVTQTELDLSRQEEGVESFSSSGFARLLVRFFIASGKLTQKIIPGSIHRFVNSRFDSKKVHKKVSEKGQAFDLLRASVNLMVASALISLGTSLKLPLSTTYVTFMVSMGTSLSDRAWGRESAVYRISGVVTVILGWFFTAFAAFTASFTIALLIHATGIYGIIALVLLVIFLIFRSYRIHKKRQSEKDMRSKIAHGTDETNNTAIVEACKEYVLKTFLHISSLYFKTIDDFLGENRRNLKEDRRNIKSLNKDVKYRKDNVHSTLQKLEDNKTDAGPYYVQIMDFMREIGHNLDYLSDPLMVHIENNHKPLNSEQLQQLKSLNEEVNELFNYIIHAIKSDQMEERIHDLLQKQQYILDLINENRKAQVKMIKKGHSGTKASILYFNILNETKNLMLNTMNTIKSHRDFVSHID